MGLHFQENSNPSDSCRLLHCSDGRIALNMAREEDWGLLPAWLEIDTVISDWEMLQNFLGSKQAQHLTQRGREIGLAIGLDQAPECVSSPFNSHRIGQKSTPHETPLVVDLSSLWAGPLAGRLLSTIGNKVIKAESLSRPDGARRGSVEFFQRLNGMKESQMFDLQASQGVKDFKTIISKADIVIEASRPRALRQMGIIAEDLIAARPGKVWLSITAYGRDDPQGSWIGFGDDVAVDAGLSFGKDHICGDAIADPLTGISGALAAWKAWQNGGGCLIDLAMRNVVSHALC